LKKALLKRVDSIDFSELLEWHDQRKAIKGSIDTKRSDRNVMTKEIQKLMAAKEDATEARNNVKKLGEEISECEQRYKELDEKIHNFLAYLPNIPEDEVPAGGKENNVPIKTIGEKPEYSYKFKDHVDLATSLKLVDYERGSKMGGQGKWVYWGDGAHLEWALLNYFVDFHRKNGFTFVLPPHLLRVEAGYNAGQFPKFEGDVFYVTSRANDEELSHFLLPTAETAIANLYANEVIPQDELPLQLFGYTPCYRREAGTYRTSERGTIRGNQFNKVEMFIITTPDDSENQFQNLVKAASDLMEGLGLHFQVTRLAAQDCSEAMAKTYDIEVWLPSINEYKEVSSVSTSHTFQAIRGNVKYKDKETKKNKFVHTLNGSGLATSRLLPAILEQNQLEDGRVKIPEVLQPYLGKEYFEKPE
jgi:seryl-tRNA synthetase